MELDDEDYALLSGASGVPSLRYDFRLGDGEMPTVFELSPPREGKKGPRDTPAKILGQRPPGHVSKSIPTRTKEEMREWMMMYRASARGKKASDAANARYEKTEKGRAAKRKKSKTYYRKNRVKLIEANRQRRKASRG